MNALVTQLNVVDGGTVTLDLDVGDVFEIRPAGDFTVVVANPLAAPYTMSFRVRLVVPAAVTPTVTWPAAFSGQPTAFQASTTYLLHVVTFDAGVTWAVTADGRVGAETPTLVSLAADDGAVDLTAGNHFAAGIPTGAIEFTIAGTATGAVVNRFSLLFTQAAVAVSVTWPFDVWVGGSAPTTGNNEVWLVNGVTYDNGTTWIGEANQVS